MSDLDVLKVPLSRVLLKWYDKHKRGLPWRQTTDPYAVWVSEIMCQQTQIATVLPYYERWMAKWPTVEALACANEQEVLSYWQGLGYYRRCRQLLEGARQVASHGMPQTYEQWLALPGIGPYTAAAISSICFGEHSAVVDGNVERAFARLNGSRLVGAELKKAAQKWATKNLDREHPGDSNQAIMELGAIVCTPRDPGCKDCPVESRCTAKQSWSVDQFPVRARKEKVEQLKHIVWVPLHNGKFGLRQIQKGQWWEGMWEFPRIDATSVPDDKAEEDLRQVVGPGWTEDVGSVRHSVTRFRITVYASLVRCDAKTRKLKWYSKDQLAALPMPTSQRKVLRLALGVL